MIYKRSDFIEKEFEIENVKLVKVPYPKTDYKENWWKKEYYNSPEGIAFEKQIADLCKDVILHF